MAISPGDWTNAAPASPLAGKRQRPAPSVIIYAYGDTHTAGIGTANGATSSWAGYVGAEFPLASVVNQAFTTAAGSGIGRWMSDRIGTSNMPIGSASIIMPGLTDARYNGTNANALTSYFLSLIGVIGYLAVPGVNKVFGQSNSTTLNPAVTFTGSWTTSNIWQGFQTGSQCGAWSSDTTATAEFTIPVVADVIHIQIPGNTVNPSAFRYSVNGVEQGVSDALVSPTPIAAMNDGGVADCWQPRLIRITGLEKKSGHKVKIFHTLFGNNKFLMPYVAGYDSSSSQLCPVYVVSPPRLTPNGYTVAPANASDDVMRLYQDQTRRAVRALADEGLMVYYIDTDTNAQPNNSMVAADNVNFRESWHRQIAAKVSGVMKREMVP